MLYEDITHIPSVLADMIVEFAVSREPLFYVSIAIDMTKISSAVQFQPAFLVAFNKYVEKKPMKTEKFPFLQILEEDPHEILWSWQKAAVDRLLERPPIHTNERYLVHRILVPGTELPVLVFNPAGYVVKGAVWDSSKVPFSPTTSFTGNVLLGPRAVGKKCTVLAALMRIKDIAPTSSTHSGRISHKGMVIVTTAPKMSSWEELAKAFLPSDWKVIYIKSEKGLLTDLKTQTLASADLVIVSRQTVSSAAASFAMSMHKHKRALFTMQWHAAVYDEVETLVATKPGKENHLTLDRKTIIIKSLFLAHRTIVLTANMEPWTNNMFNTRR
jgi:hypothetical protein